MHGSHTDQASFAQHRHHLAAPASQTLPQDRTKAPHPETNPTARHLHTRLHCHQIRSTSEHVTPGKHPDVAKHHGDTMQPKTSPLALPGINSKAQGSTKYIRTRRSPMRTEADGLLSKRTSRLHQAQTPNHPDMTPPGVTALHGPHTPQASFAQRRRHIAAPASQTPSHHSTNAPHPETKTTAPHAHTTALPQCKHVAPPHIQTRRAPASTPTSPNITVTPCNAIHRPRRCQGTTQNHKATPNTSQLDVRQCAPQLTDCSPTVRRHSTKPEGQITLV